MSAKRSERPQYLEALDLEYDANAWEILSASGGHREGDPIEVISLPGYDATSRSTTALSSARRSSPQRRSKQTHIGVGFRATAHLGAGTNEQAQPESHQCQRRRPASRIRSRPVTRLSACCNRLRWLRTACRTSKLHAGTPTPEASPQAHR